MPKTLCLNMIVRNEMANLPRCLGAVADHIACWVIGDTGSTDGTQDFIRGFFAERGLPGELHSFPFINFEQARNAALDRAYASSLAYDYLLFDDADMELVVEDAGFRDRLEAPAYHLVQRAGLVYWNTRLARRDVGARYRGVTHEYLDIPGGGAQRLNGVWYKDHACGSNRVDKFERDIRLLREALQQEPDSHRYWFYLAQSYRDAGRTREAAEAYLRRAEMGGWEEEAWNARLQAARCLRSLGDDGGFLREALAAFNQRPHRGEPLYDLARYYRERGMNEASVLFSGPGLALARPDQDILFLEDFVYQAGLREEFSIAANYSRDPVRQQRGHDVCNWLALNREVCRSSGELARHNLTFYAGPASTLLPSFSPRRLGFTPPDGWQVANPSVARRDDQLVLMQRCVNYTPAGGSEYKTADGSPIATRNFLLGLNGALEVVSSTEVLPPADLPEPAFGLVLGFEDARLFAWRGGLWCSSTVRQLTPEGWCEQVLARIDDASPGPCRLVEWRVLRPEGERRHEKNWMPLVAGDDLRFIYSCDPTRVLDEQARAVAAATPWIAAGPFSGGSPAVEFEGGWLALVHEVALQGEQRNYLHRFVWFDAAWVLRRVSRRFYFHRKGIEFAAGLAWHPDGKHLLISYGVDDCESWIATVTAEEVGAVMLDAAALDLAGHGTSAVATGEKPIAVDVPAKGQPSIPQVFHFITGLDDKFGGKPFSFVHYMAILSALRVNKGFVARVYYHYEPSGPYWDLIRPEVELVRVDLPTEVFGNPVEHFAHKADVLRMQILLEQGGIYLDLDTICQRPFRPLLDGRVVLGQEERLAADGSREVVGLCNATMIAPPGAEFFRLWYESYRQFSGGPTGDAWNRFSVQIPMELARQHPHLLRVEPAASFFWPSWDRGGIDSLFARDVEFPEAFSFHVWESQSWHYLKDLNADVVKRVNTTYNRVARRFLPSETAERQAMPSDQSESGDIGEPFSRIYRNNVWGRGSGVGSMPHNNIEYSAFIQKFIAHNGIRSVVDFGCGDWQFSRYIDWTSVNYTGIDIVDSVVAENARRFGSESVSFRKFESLETLPGADLLICKDVLQHLPTGTVKNYLESFKKKYKVLLITNDDYPDDRLNTDINAGEWRTLRLDIEPFSERASVVFSWVVLSGSATTRKSTYLLYGRQ